MTKSTKTEEEQGAQAYSGEYKVPSLEGVRGRVEFEGPGGHLYVTIDDGKLTVSPSDGQVDCKVTSDIPGELLRLVRGESNLVTAMLQGRIDASGDAMLLVRIAGSMPELGRGFQAAGGR
jgi:hypothetical protein